MTMKTLTWLVNSECEDCLGFGFVETFDNDATQTMTRSVCPCVVPATTQEVESADSAYSKARARFLRESANTEPASTNAETERLS